MKVIAKLLAVAAAAAAFPLASGAATWSTTNPWGQYQLGSYTIYNDVWGGGAGPQTLYVDTNSASAPHFWAWSSQSGNGIKSYPNGSKTINKTVTSISSLHGYHNESTSYSSGTFAYDWAYDCWMPTEVMIWTNWVGGVGPWGSLYQSNVSIGGRTWNVYKPGGPWSFLATSKYTSGTTDLAAIFKWLVNGGHLPNGTLKNCQYGVEITSGTGTWTVNSMSIY
ncbi:MAG TPA: hypothetical protein VFT72_15360 [Opitutaceae bacterium]|nr:hypothetical protein [Opitutaceae bacterium]